MSCFVIQMNDWVEEKDGVSYVVDYLQHRLFPFNLNNENNVSFLTFDKFSLIAGKIEKPAQPTSKDKSALKTAAKETAEFVYYYCMFCSIFTFKVRIVCARKKPAK